MTINCPLTSETRNLINRETLSLMKQSAILINTARGPVVDEYALAHALKHRIIASAGIDVFASEPISSTSSLLTCDNVLISS